MPSNTTDQLLEDAKGFALQQSIFNLLEGGVDEAFVLPIVEQFRAAINVGGLYEDLVQELQLLITGDGERLGALQKYAKQVNKDAISQFNSGYNKILTNSLGLEFAEYVGGRKRDTRPFCIKYRQRFYHNEEIRLMGEGIDPFTGNKLNSELLKGRIPTTTGSNIWTNRGGYNCEHFFIGVETELVPKSVVNRAIENGYYKP